VIGALRAAAMLGASSIVAIITTLATAKGLALLVGPHGVGVFALLQSVVDLGALIGGLGVGVSLVRLIADGAGSNPDRAAAVRRASGVLAWTIGALAAAVVVLWREPIATELLGSPDLAAAVALVAVAIPFTLAATAKIAALSAFREVGAIALLRTAAVIATAIATLAAVWLVGEAGSAIGILVAAIGLWLGASVFIRSRTPATPRVDWRSVVAAARRLVRFGLPFAASSVVGTGIQLGLPIIVAIRLSTDAAGFYRAATQISAGYLAFVAAAMLQDYYPRLSAEQRRPDVLVRLIDEQLRLVMILTVPLILIGLAVSDAIVPILYSEAFVPAVAILGWQLVGTLLRLPSWTLAFAILARGRSGTYFLIELLGGVVLVVASLVGMDRLGLPGLGVAVLVTYLVYYPAAWLMVRRDLPLRVTNAQRLLIVTAAIAVAIQVLPEVGFGAFRQPLAMIQALVAIVVAAIAVRGILARRHTGRSTDPSPPAPPTEPALGGPEPSGVR
jgi:PST family polysaccharide transporter